MVIFILLYSRISLSLSLSSSEADPTSHLRCPHLNRFHRNPCVSIRVLIYTCVNITHIYTQETEEIEANSLNNILHGL